WRQSNASPIASRLVILVFIFLVTAIPQKIWKKCWLAGLNLPLGRHEIEKHAQTNRRHLPHLAADLQSYSRALFQGTKSANEQHSQLTGTRPQPVRCPEGHAG